MAYLLKRIGVMLLCLLGATFIVFFILHLTGDPTNLLLPDDATPAERETFRQEMGFDRPLTEQYLDFLSGLSKGDFGYSYRYHEPALKIVLERLPATIELMLAAVVLLLLITIPIAIYSVRSESKIVQGLYMGVTFLGQSIPGFVLGINLILLFSVKLHWLPPGSREHGLKSLVMPAAVLALYGAPQMIRVLRTSLASVMDMDYVLKARAIGQSEFKVMILHVFRNALIPFITVLGVQIGILLGGSVITETVFSWPGLGQMMVQAIENRDYPVVQAGMLISAFFIMAINLIVDLLYAVIDPRIQY